jgi:hypothetical protein
MQFLLTPAVRNTPEQSFTRFESRGGNFSPAYTQVMKTLTRTFQLSLTFAAMLSTSFVGAASLRQPGTMQVTVMDENGNVVKDAPVYIYGEHKTHFVGGEEIAGSVTFEMQPGEYKVSTALIKKTGEYLDRFASHEAHVQVLPGDNTSVILTLMPIQEPTSRMDYAEIHKIGVDDQIARSFN